MISNEDVIIAKLDFLQKQVANVEKEHKPNKKRVLSILELSKLYNIGGKRIRKAIDDGDLSYINLNNRDVSIYQGDFETWLDSLKRCKKSRSADIYSGGEQLLKSSVLLGEMAAADKKQRRYT